jgi:hypothetical protein
VSGGRGVANGKAQKKVKKDGDTQKEGRRGGHPETCKKRLKGRNAQKEWRRNGNPTNWQKKGQKEGRYKKRGGRGPKLRKHIKTET